jgi:hypothetical protein
MITALCRAITQLFLVRHYHYCMRNSPEESSSHLPRGGSLISCIILSYFNDNIFYIIRVLFNGFVAGMIISMIKQGRMIE